MAADNAPVFENVPVHVNLADAFDRPMDVIGWANAFRNSETGKTTIAIILSKDASDKLANLAEVFDLKAVGFAGIKKREEKTTKQSGRQVHDAACAWVTRAETCDCHLAHTEREQDGD